MSALSFCFESNQVRVLGNILNPLFVALDICKALGFGNPYQAIKDHVDQDDLCKQEITDTMGRKQDVNCVNESGMYALIFGSKLPSAKRFKKWVTSEVLPAIRKTGQYSATEQSSEAATITPAQQLAIQNAVARRAKGASVHFHTIYRAIKLRFQIAKYDQLPQSQFEECLEFIKTVDLHVPEPVQKEEPKPMPLMNEAPKQRYAVINSDEIIVKKDSVMRLLNEAEQTLDQIRGLESHLLGCVHETIFRLELSRNA